MKIRIKDHGRGFIILLPTGLFFSNTCAKLANRYGRKAAPEAMACISPEALEILFAELRRIKKKHGVWELAEVESADGEYVKITL